MEQSRSASILVEGHRVDLAHEGFPTRHHRLASFDFDRHLLVCNFAEQIGGRRLPHCSLWSSFRIAGPCFFELTGVWWLSIAGTHFRFLNASFSLAICSGHLGPKRCAASVWPMISVTWSSSRSSSAKYLMAMFVIRRAALRSLLVAFAKSCRKLISAFVMRLRLPLSVTTISSLSIVCRTIPGSSGLKALFGRPLGLPDLPL